MSTFKKLYFELTISDWILKKIAWFFFFILILEIKFPKYFFFIFDFYVLEEKKSYVAVNLRIALNLVKALIFE